MNHTYFARTASILSLLLLAAVHSARSQNLVSNGGFEDPAILHWYQPEAAGSTNITSWTVDIPNPPGQNDQGVDIIRRTGWVQSGLQSIDMSGSPGPGTIYQNLATVPGKIYSLEFYASSVPLNTVLPGSLTLEWGGNVIDTVDTPARGTWTEFDYCVEASSTTTRLEFVSNVFSNEGALLDTVSVTEIPTPNLVSNGDFELPRITSESVSVSTGNGVPAWEVDDIHLVSTRDGRKGFAHTGEQAVELANESALKTFPAAVPGETYRLTFAVSSNGSAKPNALRVVWGRQIARISTPAEGTWDQHTFLVSAPSDSLQFSGTNTGNEGPLLDNVRVVRACP